MGLFRSAASTRAPIAGPAATDVPEVSVDESVELHRQGALLLDVRDPAEWHAGRTPTAVHLPLSHLHHQLPRLDPRRPVLVICRTGARSRQAVAALRAAGIAAHSIEGGMRAWAEADREMVRTGSGPVAVI